jgi:transcriptional regulator with XRE-family HTH domain
MTAGAARQTPTTAVAINGAALRELRKRTGISVADLAGEVGVTRPYLAKIELGHSKRVSPAVYTALLRALNINDYRTLLAQDVA